MFVQISSSTRKDFVFKKPSLSNNWGTIITKLVFIGNCIVLLKILVGIKRYDLSPHGSWFDKERVKIDFYWKYHGKRMNNSMKSEIILGTYGQTPRSRSIFPWIWKANIAGNPCRPCSIYNTEKTQIGISSCYYQWALISSSFKSRFFNLPWLLDICFDNHYWFYDHSNKARSNQMHVLWPLPTDFVPPVTMKLRSNQLEIWLLMTLISKVCIQECSSRYFVDLRSAELSNWISVKAVEFRFSLLSDSWLFLSHKNHYISKPYIPYHWPFLLN